MYKYIEINKLSNEAVFYNLNLILPMSKLIYLSGPNNCGKTTLIRILDKKIKSKYTIKIDNKELNTNNLIEYYDNIECLIPNEIIFNNNTVEKELNNYDNKQIDKDALIKELKLSKYKNTLITNLDIKNRIKLQLLISLLKKPKLLLIDNIMSYFNKKEVDSLNSTLKKYIKKYKTTILITTIDLNNTIDSDHLIIMSNNYIILEGQPLEVLSHDNIINKIGLDLPFIIDLSSKLKDYNLIENIETNKERLIDSLWK